ncbi:phosphate acetyltransferase [Mycobacterium sp. M1]|uniref:Phosphate acetyltransferase n=1 Tax=Mycolicibacter acidiphilus TaxID=2835306 RepID=A0ABS5RRD7_9MYCO|nr:phosphate acetyltransferase [Mycolicibacter acidiphilus]MBS9536093.1 phosphate acetyltransferase [Mycolicibacter acidiphilus]
MSEPTPDTRASSIYLAATEGGTGKSAIALGLLHLLASSAARVGVFRPIVRSHEEPDEQLELLLAHATATLDDHSRCRGVTYQQVYSDREAALSEIVARFHEVARQCDTVLVVGSDYTDVVNPSELSFNARIAVNLGAPLVLAINGHNRDPQAIAEIAGRCLAEAAAVHAQPAAVIANRCVPAHLDDVQRALSGVLGAAGVPAFAVPEVRVLAAPTMAELCAALGGTVYSGDPELLRREALDVMVGGMTAENILERLVEGQVVIVPADRSDVLLALVNAHEAQGFPSLAGIILNGGLLPHPAIDKLVKGLQPALPLIACSHRTYDTAERVSQTGGRITVDALRKIDTALEVMASHVDGAELAERIRVPASTVVTPQMFEYRLLERARSGRRHIVLPEGDDDRILLAAGRLLSRGIVDLTLLGVESTVRARGAELGVDLSAAQVIDPQHSDLLDSFGAEYARLRAHKGMTEERAREIMRDISYFGTMMVHRGIADGMVSGAAHTTAHTIRPAFEIIRTAPGVSTVSSVFLMCLSDRVLAFGDCAVVPDPTVEQLADIAISSASTAAAFGIEPRVALLSYSTGESGFGAGVDKVRAATQLVHQRCPDLLADGPIQYDAAVDAGVAAAKMPDSAVAGAATVLIFPDLNTGNNTYKAVQRSAGVVAIGPVLQGLAKPVNDLSRGALVDDIVYTVAITAVQAQEVGR